jgi:ATP-dependent RNA helicase
VALRLRLRLCLRFRLCASRTQVYDIFRFMPPTVQCVIVSATMPRDVLELTEKFMEDPIRILIKREEVSVSAIKQFHVNVESEEWKFDTLTGG